VSEDKARISQMPHLYDVFEMPKIKALRAVTNLRFKLNIKEAMKIPNIKTIRTANKDIVKFELRRGAYLLLFPGGYVEVHAPDEESMRSVLLAFREELFKHGLIK
jgi:hypothetical protein